MFEEISAHFYKHKYCDNSVYWMSWGGSFAGHSDRCFAPSEHRLREGRDPYAAVAR